MSRFKQIVFFLAVAIVITWLCTILQSTDFLKYLREKIVELLITLMAINTATVSVVVTKLHDIGRAENINLQRTINEVRVSLLEQIILIIISVLLIILYNSPIVKMNFVYHDLFFNTLFVTVFIYAIDILRDTGMAIFEIIKFIRTNEKDESQG